MINRHPDANLVRSVTKALTGIGVETSLGYKNLVLSSIKPLVNAKLKSIELGCFSCYWFSRIVMVILCCTREFLWFSNQLSSPGGDLTDWIYVLARSHQTIVFSPTFSTGVWIQSQSGTVGWCCSNDNISKVLKCMLSAKSNQWSLLTVFSIFEVCVRR